MNTVSYTAARAKLAQTMESVCDDRAPVIITRQNARPVVMMSLEDFKALEETACLLRTPSNARRLLAAVAQLESGKGVERKLGKAPVVTILKAGGSDDRKP